MKIFMAVLLATCVAGDKLDALSQSNASRKNDARALRQTQGGQAGGYPYQVPNIPFSTGSASFQNPVSQPVPVPANYLPPTNARPTFAPPTAPPTRPAVQPPRPQPVRPIPATNPPATFAPQQPIVLPQRPVIVPIPAPSIVVDITRPTVEPVISEISSNMLLMPQQPNGPMPTISNLDVKCSKESMIVTIVFSLPFSGTVYAKGFHTRPECTFVSFNSRQTSYTFTLVLNQCGTQFINEISAGGQAYLENTIIIQNEPGIQEIWDTSRQIRCLWEGQLEKIVSASFAVDQLDSQIVSFSGDTASAFMDIQIGKGPFAPSANGLVRIGETMTMVVSVNGDPGFDIHVRDCIAHDGNRNNPVVLTDSNGCVLKKKLMGPWQKSRQTGKADVNIVAFSFFQAFKFPDQVEVFLECNIELCKNECGFCPEDQDLFDVRDGRRRKRSLAKSYSNATEVSDPVRLAKRLRVLAPDDLTYSNGRSTITLTSGEKIRSNDELCLSLTSFIVGMIVTLFILIVSCVITAILCTRVRNIPGTESTYPPSTNSYHAFSTISKSIS